MLNWRVVWAAVQKRHVNIVQGFDRVCRSICAGRSRLKSARVPRSSCGGRSRRRNTAQHSMMLSQQGERAGSAAAPGPKSYCRFQSKGFEPVRQQQHAAPRLLGQSGIHAAGKVLAQFRLKLTKPSWLCLVNPLTNAHLPVPIPPGPRLFQRQGVWVRFSD